MGDHNEYLEAERVYERLCNNHPDVIQEMKDLIDQYAESRDDVYGNRAGRSILPKHPSFQGLCGDRAAQVFGILLRDHLTAASWDRDEEEDGRGKKVTVYRRP